MSKKDYWDCKECGGEHHLLASHCLAKEEADYRKQYNRVKKNGLIPIEVFERWEAQDNKNEIIKARLKLHMEGNG